MERFLKKVRPLCFLLKMGVFLMASNDGDLVSLGEAARELGIGKKALLAQVEKGRLKISMRGKLSLVSLKEARSLKAKLEAKALRKGAIAAQKELTRHLKETISHLKEENKELRKERRLAEARADHLLFEMQRLSLPAPQEAAATMRQGASFKEHLDLDENGDIDLEGLCQDLDEKRGIAKGAARGRQSFWQKIGIGKSF